MTLLTFFYIVGILGIVLVLLSLFGVGGDHDFDHSFDSGGDSDSSSDSGPSLFSYRVIISFITAFGMGGVLTYRLSEATPLWSVFAGIITGIVVALIVWGLLKITFSQQASSLINDKDFIGMSGIVTIPIFSNQIGEISVVVNGQKKILMATVDSGECPEGALIQVKEINAGIALVELKPKN